MTYADLAADWSDPLADVANQVERSISRRAGDPRCLRCRILEFLETSNLERDNHESNSHDSHINYLHLGFAFVGQSA